MTMQPHPIRYTNILAPTVFYFASYFSTLSLSSQIFIHEVCLEMKEDDCYGATISTRASNRLLFISLAASVPTLFMSGLYSSVADKYGRKVVIIMPIVGLFVRIVTLLYVHLLHPPFYFGMYFLSSFISGILGSQINFNMGIFTYTSDTTQQNPSSRSTAFTVVEICMMTPKIASYFVAGLLVNNYGFTVPLLVSLLFTSASFVSVCLIPESLNRLQESVEFNLLNAYTNLNLLFTGSDHVKRLSLAYFLFYFCLVGSSSIDILYFKYKFEWGPDFIGYYESAEGILTSASMALICHCGQIPLARWVAIGYFFRMLFWILVGFAHSMKTIFIALPFLLFTGAVSPYTRTLVSTNINQENVAKSFTAFSTLQNTSMLMTPILNICYSVGVQHHLPGLVYQMMSGILFGSFMCVLSIPKVQPLQEKLLGEDSVQSELSA